MVHSYLLLLWKCWTKKRSAAFVSIAHQGQKREIVKQKQIPGRSEKALQNRTAICWYTSGLHINQFYCPSPWQLLHNWDKKRFSAELFFISIFWTLINCPTNINFNFQHSTYGSPREIIWGSFPTKVNEYFYMGIRSIRWQLLILTVP